MTEPLPLRRILTKLSQSKLHVREVPVHPDRFLDAFHRISKTAGLRATRPHDLRHGWATRALEAGVPAKVVQEVLGHSSAMVTLDIYSHVVPSMRATRRSWSPTLTSKR